MKIFIACSKAFYSQVPPIKSELEHAGHIITLPNSFDNPGKEDEMRTKGALPHAQWKADKIKEQNRKILNNDVILVLNLQRNEHQNYIGGATFLEMYKAFELGKPIFLYNPVPSGMLRDEILSFQPIVINGDLSLVGKN